MYNVWTLTFHLFIKQSSLILETNIFLQCFDKFKCKQICQPKK